jgi:hypothetical protein
MPTVLGRNLVADKTSRPHHSRAGHWEETEVNDKMRRALGSALLLGTIGAATLSLPAGVAAKDGDIVRTGNCSGSTDWKLKLSPENGRIEVEFEVDSNRVGQTWNVRLKNDGNVFFRGTRTTQAPSGSFEVRRLTNNGAGSDFIVGRAVNPNTGEVCRGTATF